VAARQDLDRRRLIEGLGVELALGAAEQLPAFAVVDEAERLGLERAGIGAGASVSIPAPSRSILTQRSSRTARAAMSTVAAAIAAKRRSPAPKARASAADSVASAPRPSISGRSRRGIR
jgi:hypothetical protein